MTRRVKAQAIVLRARPVGENHRGLSMLVSGEGLLEPLAYGAQGRRSGLKGTAVPYNQGLAALHFDGVRRSWRLTDFDTVDTHDGLREDLERFYTAALWAEILLKSYGGGCDSEKVFQLTAEAFSRLSLANDWEINRLRVLYLWNLLDVEGTRPDPGHCGMCERTIKRENLDASVRYAPDGLLCCPECAHSNWPSLPDRIRLRLMERTIGLAPEPGVRVSTEELLAAESWIISVIQTLVETPLKSLKNHYSLRFVNTAE